MSNIPKLRFPEFTDAWEKWELGKIVNIVGGGTPDTNNATYWNGNIDWYSPTEIGNEIYVSNSLKKISKLGLEKSSAKLLPANKTILFTSRASIGDMAILLKSSTTNQGFQSFVVDEEKVDIYFLYSLGFKIKHFALKNATGSTFLEISKKQLEKMEISIPTLPEQQKIGNLFKQLDRLITLHKRKWDDVILLKKALLQKMFPKNGSDFPALRFPEFTDAWEKCKLEKYLEVSNEKNINNKYSKQEVLSVSGEFGIINQIEFKGRSFAGASVEKYSVVDTGDIVYTKSPLQNNPYGIIKTNKGIAGIVSTLYAVYHPKKDTDPEFVQTYFDLHSRTNNYLAPLVNKGAKNDMKISSENALKGFVTFPKFSEQQKIGNLFKQLDRLITLHK